MSKEYQAKPALEVLSESYVEIAKYVAKTRAYASMIDGMKSVYRRLVYGSRNIKGKVRSNIITSECGKYHPHGDSIYDVLVNATCPYGAFPLYDGYGNFGGCGFQAASMRYTSAKLNDIARLMYLELVDYADYVEGDSGEDEPLYLPSLIPYALCAGSRGMTVGLPTPNIPPFNIMELIDYFEARLTDSPFKYPSIDIGKAEIYANSSSDLVELYKTGRGRVEYHAILDYDENVVRLSSFPSNTKLWNMNKYLELQMTSGIIEYSDTTSKDGISYEYLLAKPDKLPCNEFKELFESKSWSADNYRFYFEWNSKVYQCSFDKVATESLAYLKKCAIRKFEHDKIDLEFKVRVLEAIKKLKESDELSSIATKPSSYYKELITGWGFSQDVASAAMSKSITYLTNSHNSELDKLYQQYNYTLEMITNPTEYLLGLYERLRELVTPFYESRVHSTYTGL